MRKDVRRRGGPCGPPPTGEGDGAPLPPPGDRGGFVLAMVVLFLFAIAVAATAGYQMVNTEFMLSQSSREGQKALVVARAGLERFLGEQIGVVGDSVSYAIGDGIATITTRKVLEEDSLNHLYYVRSEGNVADIRMPDDPAQRVVGTYAWHRMSPLPHKGAVVMTEGNLRLRNAANVSGLDAATALECPGGGTAGVAGVATSRNVVTQGGATVIGNPDEETFYADFQEVYDTLGIRWDILSDPNLPVEFEGHLPNYAALPSDSFPMVRYDGDVTAWIAGRGVLIVTGIFAPRSGSSWDGIVLAGELGTISPSYQPTIRGMLVAGLNEGAQANIDVRSGIYQYHSCNAYAANRALSYLERVDHAVFEAN